ncbi:MAG TPA: hypothetical protein VKY74_18535 [Chloroflexia bacterium]|nr:hypothetical protein [Chloroflexia bacterium]
MKRFNIGQVGWIAVIGGLGWILLAPHAAAGGLPAPGDQAPATSDVGTLLAPLLAASTGIERVIEMFWSWFESGATQVVASLGLGQAWARYARNQIAAAETALTDLAIQAEQLRHPAPGTPPAVPATGTALDQKIDEAQQKLADAQQQLRNALKSDRYTSLKQSISVLTGLVLGLIVAYVTRLDMFQLLNLSKNAGDFGLIVTGLIIGAGSGPVHSVIGLLQQSRDAVDQAANLFSSRARQNATQTLTALMTANAASAAPPPDSGTRDLGPAAPAAPAPVTQEQLRMIERLATR